MALVVTETLKFAKSPSMSPKLKEIVIPNFVYQELFVKVETRPGPGHSIGYVLKKVFSKETLWKIFLKSTVHVKSV